ncbi:MAG: DUF465 domain-containing protein [Alphaproteobacteria bacterium]|jgi:hypothetical protein|nr:DUF465 domain-containing protein [Alphaproteobacteria bacterium]
MNNQNHALELERKHAELEKAIAEEEKRPSPDNIRLAKLKSEKLKLRDRLANH